MSIVTGRRHTLNDAVTVIVKTIEWLRHPKTSGRPDLIHDHVKEATEEEAHKVSDLVDSNGSTTCSTHDAEH
jgi:hypothetical protein